MTVLIPVEGDSQQLTPILRQLVPQWGYLQNLPDKKSLLVVDRVSNIKRIAALVKAQPTAEQK